MIGLFAALSAALAIVAGAFGAHGASSPQAAQWLQTGASYQLIHAVGALALMARTRGAAATLLAGGGLFGASLYLLALDGPRWLGAVAPTGGTLLVAGWLWAAWTFARK